MKGMHGGNLVRRKGKRTEAKVQKLNFIKLQSEIMEKRGEK